MRPAPQSSLRFAPTSRTAAAERFAVTYGKRRDYSFAKFKVALKGHLACRDIAYPEHRQEKVNLSRCYAIAANVARSRHHDPAQIALLPSAA